MKLKVNGEPREVAAVQTVADYLTTLGLESERVVVERNGAILTRGEFTATALQEGDTLEIVQFVGGG